MAITAKIIADSVAENGTRLTTFELEYPRFIHSEFLTHRTLSRNAASSRAIPLKKMISLVWNNPAIPIHWGMNQRGMQAACELNTNDKMVAKFIWKLSGKVACIFAWGLGKIGLHKQVANRILEPWSHIKVVASATDWDNFFHLRRHPDAQPEIHELANQMWDVYQVSNPASLKMGEWHLPYVQPFYVDGELRYGRTIRDMHNTEPELVRLSLEDAKKISASCCAQVSYRLLDNSVDKATMIYDRLVKSTPVHASPFEHQATPFKHHITESGNFRGWDQLRQEITGNVCKDYVPLAVELEEDLTPTDEETGTHNEI